jgi:hypothetical protein
MGISFENTEQAEKFTGKISKVYNYTEKGVKRKFQVYFINEHDEGTHLFTASAKQVLHTG